MHPSEDYLTKEKFQELGKELEHLKTVKRKEVAEALEYAKSLGDLSENQEYQEARDSQAILEDRINRLEIILKSAKIVSARSTNIVSVGSVVTLEKESDKSRKSYTMVGSEEADAARLHRRKLAVARKPAEGEDDARQRGYGERETQEPRDKIEEQLQDRDEVDALIYDEVGQHDDVPDEKDEGEYDD